MQSEVLRVASLIVDEVKENEGNPEEWLHTPKIILLQDLVLMPGGSGISMWRHWIGTCRFDISFCIDDSSSSPVVVTCYGVARLSLWDASLRPSYDT